MRLSEFRNYLNNRRRKKGVWLLDYLLKNCKDIQDLEEKSGSTPLFMAAGYNNVDAVKYLIENNFYDVNSQLNGMTILMKAAHLLRGKQHMILLKKMVMPISSP